MLSVKTRAARQEFGNLYGETDDARRRRVALKWNERADAAISAGIGAVQKLLCDHRTSMSMAAPEVVNKLCTARERIKMNTIIFICGHIPANNVCSKIPGGTVVIGLLIPPHQGPSLAYAPCCALHAALLAARTAFELCTSLRAALS